MRFLRENFSKFRTSLLSFFSKLDEIGWIGDTCFATGFRFFSGFTQKLKSSMYKEKIDFQKAATSKNENDSYAF